MYYTDFKYKDGQIVNGLLLTNPHREIMKGHSTKVYDYMCLKDKYKSASYIGMVCVGKIKISGKHNGKPLI